MKKKGPAEYGVPLLLYPGLTVRAGSIMQVAMPYKRVKKEYVDKHVDKSPIVMGLPKLKALRPGCLKNQH